MGALGATRQGESTRGGLGTATWLVWLEHGGAMGVLGHGDHAVRGEDTQACTSFGMCGVVRSLKARPLPLLGGENAATSMANTRWWIGGRVTAHHRAWGCRVVVR